MEVTRKIEFDAGHRVLGHGGKCRYLHGHRYVAEVSVSTDELNRLGMVIDFGDVKDVVKSWIDSHWDHNLLLNTEDPLWEVLNSPEALHNLNGGKIPYRIEQNPTAEVMAEELLWQTQTLIQNVNAELLVTKVRLFETPNCWADFRNPNA